MRIIIYNNQPSQQVVLPDIMSPAENVVSYIV